jgi:PhnB protein
VLDRVGDRSRRVLFRRKLALVGDDSCRRARFTIRVAPAGARSHRRLLDRIVEAKESNVTEVIPHIVVRDAARAAEWYERALGARLGARVPVPDGRLMQIELLFGDSRVMIADEFPEFGAVSPLTLGGTYGALTITTDAVDELWERALAEGAHVHSPLQDAFWGERHGQILDPFGHRWGLAQHLEDVPQDELVRRAAEVFGGGAA